MLNNYFLSLIAALAFFDGVYSQAFQGGLSAGVIASQIDGDGYEGFDKFGATFGGFVTNNFGTNNIAMQLEINYIDKGSRRVPNFEHGITYYMIKLNYVEVPVFIKYKYKKLWLEGGLSYARLIKYQEFDYTESDLSGYMTSIGRPFKKNEYAFLAGGSMDINKKLSVTAHYIRSVYPVRDYATFTRMGIWGGSYNTVISVVLHYRILTREKEKNNS